MILANSSIRRTDREDLVGGDRLLELLVVGQNLQLPRLRHFFLRRFRSLWARSPQSRSEGLARLLQVHLREVMVIVEQGRELVGVAGHVLSLDASEVKRADGLARSGRSGRSGRSSPSASPAVPRQVTELTALEAWPCVVLASWLWARRSLVTWLSTIDALGLVCLPGTW